MLAFDCPLARASSSTLREPCASRSISSSRRGLANALPISAIASNSASLGASRIHLLLFKRSIDTLSSPDPCPRRPTCSSASCSTTKPPAPRTCSAARAAASSRSSIRTSTWSTSTSRSPRPRACRSSPSSRRTCRPTTSPGLPELVARTGATAYLPGGRGRRLRPPPARRRRGRPARQHRVRRRSRRPGHAQRASRLPGHRPRPRRRARGWCSPATRCSSATPAGPTCTPTATTASRRWPARCTAR